jgi:hypothetical protein
MKRSQRGAAKVSVVWAICLFMAFAAAAVAYFLSNQDTAIERARAEDAEATIKRLNAEAEAQVAYLQQVTARAGFNDATQASRIDPAAIDAAMTQLKGAFPQIDATATTLAKTVPIVVEAYKAEQRKVVDANARVAELTTENGSIRGNVDQIRQQMEKDVGDLRRQLADAEQSYNDQKAELERQLAERATNMQASDQGRQAALAQLEELKRKATLEADSWRTRVAEAERKLTPFTKEPEAADGRVLSVSPELRLGWINIGGTNRLSRGTRFKVVDGQSGSKKVKAWAEVSKVENSMAEVTFSEQADPFDPVVAGDVVYNPVFDPTGERSAVLIGRFSGGMNEDALKALLKSMNISVTKDLEKTTDFLIVGAEMFTNPENGQPLETPMQPSEMPIYKEAQAQGVQVVALKELRQFFRTN